MFPDIDKKNKNSIAAFDNQKNVLTYGDLSSFCQEFGRKIQQRCLIFILCENSIGSLAGYIASLQNRIVPLLLSSNTEPSLLQNLISVYHPEFIWAPDSTSIKIGEPEPIFSAYSYSLYSLSSTPYSLHPDLALLLTTSGSTGSPKLVRHSYSNITASSEIISSFFELTPHDKAMAILPMNYTMGLSVINSHIHTGAQILLYKGTLTEKGFFDFLKETKATSFTGVPFSYEILYKLRFQRMDLPHLTTLAQGGGKLKPEIFREFAEYAQKNGKRFFATYGQTEGTARMAFLNPDLALVKTGSIGKAIPQGQLSLIDETGTESWDGEATGTMLFRGPNVTMGYALSGKDLAKGDENKGLLNTGDIAKRDKDGFYYILGRNSRFLKLFGVRVSLDESEQLIKDNFNIDCLCTGSDEKMIIKITRADLKDSILQFFVEKTGIFHAALEVVITDQIPRNESGKLIYS